MIKINNRFLEHVYSLHTSLIDEVNFFFSNNFNQEDLNVFNQKLKNKYNVNITKKSQKLSYEDLKTYIFKNKEINHYAGNKNLLTYSYILDNQQKEETLHFDFNVFYYDNKTTVNCPLFSFTKKERNKETYISNIKNSLTFFNVKDNIIFPTNKIVFNILNSTNQVSLFNGEKFSRQNYLKHLTFTNMNKDFQFLINFLNENFDGSSKFLLGDSKEIRDCYDLYKLKTDNKIPSIEFLINCENNSYKSIFNKFKEKIYKKTL